MLTALSVRVLAQPSGVRRLAHRLRRDKVEISIRRARGVTLKHVTYISYSGQVRLEKTDNVIGLQRSRLLCAENLVFPHNSGYKRFRSLSFRQRLCTNTALAVLKALPPEVKPRLGIIDIYGGYPEFMLRALRCCGDVTVVTRGGEVYTEAQELALNELGASAVITSRSEDLRGCHLVVAPDTGCILPDLGEKTVVLAVEPPEGQRHEQWYYSYKIQVPGGFASIKPEELDGEYFCSALYTLGAQYELGSMVPVRIEGCGRTRTIETLCASLDNRDQK